SVYTSIYPRGYRYDCRQQQDLQKRQQRRPAAAARARHRGGRGDADREGRRRADRPPRAGCGRRESEGQAAGRGPPGPSRARRDREARTDRVPRSAGPELSFLLDTDVAIHLRDMNDAFLARLGALDEVPALSVITLVEL